MEKLTIIKVGGKLVEEPESLAALLQEFKAIPGKKLLVHGGGRTATKLASDLGIETLMIEGRRVTDAAMLRVVTMVYGGLVNKDIVAKLGALGIKALGLTGADMDVVRSHKRTGTAVDYGFVGDVDHVDGERLAMLIQSGITPVLAPLTHDGQGNMLNTNADTMAGEAAKALAHHFDVTLTFCFEKPGVLTDPDDDTSVVHCINTASYAELKAAGSIQGGMIPKLDNSFAALQAGVSQVLITKVGQLLHPEQGTTISLA